MKEHYRNSWQYRKAHNYGEFFNLAEFPSINMSANMDGLIPSKDVPAFCSGDATLLPETGPVGNNDNPACDPVLCVMDCMCESSILTSGACVISTELRVVLVNGLCWVLGS